MFKTPVPAARRAGMLAAGITLWLGFAMFVLACIEVGLERRLTPLPGIRPHEVILDVWTVAGLMGLAVYVLARARPRLLGDIEPVPAFVVPAAGAASLMPLTVWLVVFAVLGDRSATRDFDECAPGALALTAIAHLWFVVCVGQQASDLVAGFAGTTVKRIYVTTILAGAVPGLLLLGIPCLFIALTGLPILPMLHAMNRYAALDRDGAWVPTARAIVA